MGQTFLRSESGFQGIAAGSEPLRPMAVDGTLRQTLEQLRRQGLAWMRHDLVANGDLIGAGSVCRLLGGISREELDERIERQELLALPPVELESLGRVEGFPRVQFTETGVLPGLAQVLAAMPDEDPWVKFNYLVNPDVRLAGRRPIDLLGQGEIEAVVAAARRVGEFEPDESPFLF